jgi:hypothetical protein
VLPQQQSTEHNMLSRSSIFLCSSRGRQLLGTPLQ